MCTSTEFVTVTKEAKDYNDPYGECLHEFHVASEMSNIVQL